jgi:hypothetical protein
VKENQGLLFNDDIPPDSFVLSSAIEVTLNGIVGIQQMLVYIDNIKKSKMKQ